MIRQTGLSLANVFAVLGNGSSLIGLATERTSPNEHAAPGEDQYLILPYLVAAVRYKQPSYGYDRVMHGDLLTAAPQLESQCTGDTTPADVALGTAATPAEARFADDAAAPAVSDFESRTNLPKTVTTLPTYIARGDADMLVSTAWSTEAIAKMCALGYPSPRPRRTGRARRPRRHRRSVAELDRRPVRRRPLRIDLPALIGFATATHARLHICVSHEGRGNG